MSATAQCPHSDVHVHINHARCGDTNVHYLEITARCKNCDRPMVFRGLPMGMSPQQPMCGPGGHEARLPFLGEGEEPAGNPFGFQIRMAGWP